MGDPGFLQMEKFTVTPTGETPIRHFPDQPGHQRTLLCPASSLNLSPRWEQAWSASARSFCSLLFPPPFTSSPKPLVEEPSENRRILSPQLYKLMGGTPTPRV